MRVIRIGSRGSALALAQAEWVRAQLGAEATIIPYETHGDRVLDRALSDLGAVGVFTTELEQALLRGEIDCAVHSLKDLPTTLAAGLKIGALSPREDPRDVLVGEAGGPPLRDLAAGSRIGTSSLRRRAFLARMRPDVEVVEVRGNLATRVAAMRARGWAGLVLAAAGVHRLGWRELICEYLDPAEMVPAPGQGILAVEIRDGDAAMADRLQRIHDPVTAELATAERSVLMALGGGCQLPLGAFAECLPAGRVVLTACLAASDGTIRRARIEGFRSEAAAIGRQAAAQIRAREVPID